MDRDGGPGMNAGDKSADMDATTGEVMGTQVM